MLKKHPVLIGIIISILFLFTATLYYPGGSQKDRNSIGYDWKNNYISNLFNETAVNGLKSGSRFWAAAGMFFLSFSFALFFIRFSKKIPLKGAARVIKYFGVASMVFAFLTITPYHDEMVTISGTLALVSIFYITVFVFKSKLQIFKILSVICLLVAYSCNYIYYTGRFLALLPVMQKLAVAILIIWMLGLEYFSHKEDFQQKKTAMAATGK